VKRFAVLALLVLLLAPDPSLAQRRRRAPAKRPAPAKTAPKTDETAAVDAERRDAARKISGQIKRLSRFLYIYGGAVKTIEDADRALGANASAADREATERSKAAVAESVRNVRAGLDELENDFGTKPSLRPYYRPIIGLGATAVDAERLAGQGRFADAGNALLKALGQLTDTLAAMRDEVP
jgi:hypothetical protein